ncbi:hypothetical protein BGZ99_001775 [Dissophora globulifera]|uniref:Fe2OG dioxygenase domain-containing protein n=1 Tax=Dissophora globulifera TaxID=979702 RepID=A0A9P6RQC2_9FUNG|nr:hypothetical protein BGZ99_001775 [Dissophora globulifera]
MTPSQSPLSGVLNASKTKEILRNPPVATHLDLQHLLAPRRRNGPPVVAFTVQDILSPQECQSLIERSEKIGYEVALVNTGNKGQGVHVPGYRDGQRVMVDDFDITAELFRRIQPYLPATFEGRPVVSMNERLRFLKYKPGDQFAPHMDGQFRRDDGSGEVTKLTIQLYLNDECEGGATTFLDEATWWSGTSEGKPQLEVVPRTGQLLVFQHDLVHEGSIVTEGVKYVIRDDILYGPRP